MNPLRPAGMVVAIALIIGVVAVSFGAVALRSDDTSNTETPETEAANDDPPGPEGSDDVGTDAQEAAGSTAPTSTPEPTPEPTPVTLSEEELEQYQPNELGRVMVLMYHQIGDGESDWDRTPEQFRQDLQWLYDNGFYVIPIEDYIRNEINAPAGKRPVVLTFDDGTVSQFRYIEQADGSLEIDPNTAVGILEEFFNRYDDFGRGGLFSILPNAPFAWPEESDQMEHATEKLQWLADNGYELGNHTIDHIDLRASTNEEIKAQLIGAARMIREHVPDADVSVLAVPYGMYPPGGDTTLFEGFDYEGEHYALEGALMVGAEPGVSPVHTDFDPMWIPRINSSQEELDKWFSFAADNPGIMYVSDGNPDTLTIPEEVHPWLVDTFDETKAEGKTVVRY